MIPFKLPPQIKHFYQFLAFHTLLVGLFPVLLPSFLWMLGFTITDISAFIALSGFSFVVSLWLWDRLHKAFAFNKIIILSFLAQIGLVTIIFAKDSAIFLPLLAIFNGLVNCFFWTGQRTMFFDTIAFNNAGRKFGNFQIFVTIILNISIVIGAALLEKANYYGVYTFSIIISLSAIAYYAIQKHPPTLPSDLVESEPLTIKNILTFKDEFGSTKIFWLDGLFLYLESFFWVISLFLISHESFLNLGLLILALAFSLAIIFYIIKNTIDRVGSRQIYTLGVILYGISWVLRAMVSNDTTIYELFIFLISISFATALFRLSFNKRFFDIAKQTSRYRYLFIKSYWSQAFILLSFSIIAILSEIAMDPDLIIKGSYIAAAIFTIGYFFYKPIQTVTNP